MGIDWIVESTFTIGYVRLDMSSAQSNRKTS